LLYDPTHCERNHPPLGRTVKEPSIGKVGIQTSLGACVHAATRISTKIANINKPKPRSMTSLITSGFSKSSRRTNSPPRNQGRLTRVTALRVFNFAQPKERRGDPSCQPPPTDRQARPFPSLAGDNAADGTTVPSFTPYVNSSTVLETGQ
jgi:hypothetical protein